MNLKGKSLIAAAVAAALGSGAAVALPPTSTPAFVLYAAGGSAQANAFSVAANTILSSPDSYSDSTSACTDSGSYRVWFGATTAAIGTITAGTNILLLYKFNGGSFVNGVNPQTAAGATLAYPQTSAILSTLTTSQSCTNAGAPKYFYSDSGQLTNNQQPDWGVSDVEVPLFQGINNPGTAPSGTCATNVTNANCNGGPAPTVGAADGIYDNLFGIAVTHNVYTSTSHPKTNFSRAEMAGIIRGTISDWSQLYDDNGSQMAAGGIIFLDRGPGSGTKASGNQYFLGYPGSGSSAQLPHSATKGYTGTSLADSQTYQDVNESSTTNVINDLINAFNDGLQAVAVLGLENPPALHQGTCGSNCYDFTKINGVAVDTQGASDNINGTVATSYINVVTGAYDFFYQNSFNTRSGVIGGSTPGDLVAAQVEATMQAAGFVGANSSKSFPAAVNGTLQDADKLSAATKGGTLPTRNKVSPAPLLPKFDASTIAGPLSTVTGSDPL
ncbi:MAG TPA: hypothetical protein VEK10_06715 [Steroidobacteraceae bacterium]|nr:hypothetical protein [Steroidobacteraceae bacterium]